MANGWTYQKSGLGLREDEFSWQGSVESDPRFFLRRSKDETEKVTDLLFGELSDDAVDPLAKVALDDGARHRADELGLCDLVVDAVDLRLERFDPA